MALLGTLPKVSCMDNVLVSSVTTSWPVLDFFREKVPNYPCAGRCLTRGQLEGNLPLSKTSGYSGDGKKHGWEPGSGSCIPAPAALRAQFPSPPLFSLIAQRGLRAQPVSSSAPLQSPAERGWDVLTREQGTRPWERDPTGSGFPGQRCSAVGGLCSAGPCPGG